MHACVLADTCMHVHARENYAWLVGWNDCTLSPCTDKSGRGCIWAVSILSKEHEGSPVLKLYVSDKQPTIVI